VLQESATRPKSLSADRRVRGTVAALVILAAAGTGFLASRLWPLATPPVPTLKVTSSEATALEHSPSTQVDVPSASRPLAGGNVPATKSELADVTEKPAGASFVLLNPGTAEQPRSVEEPAQQSTAKRSDDTAEERMPPTRAAGRPRNEKGPSSQVARSQKKNPAEANPAQPAPSSTGYQRDAALRDFMSHNPPFTR